MSRTTTRRRARRSDSTLAVAKGLGWFSIGLGLAELFMPRLVAKIIGPAIDMGLAHAEGQALVHRHAHGDLVDQARINTGMEMVPAGRQT